LKDNKSQKENLKEALPTIQIYAQTALMPDE
jgi:hypothetical protein